MDEGGKGHQRFEAFEMTGDKEYWQRFSHEARNKRDGECLMVVHEIRLTTLHSVANIKAYQTVCIYLRNNGIYLQSTFLGLTSKARVIGFASIVPNNTLPLRE
jgi:hypothetical protein